MDPETASLRLGENRDLKVEATAGACVAGETTGKSLEAPRPGKAN